MMPVDGQCGCGGVVGVELCDCGMPVDQCKCEGRDHGMNEGMEPCAECGMYEVEGSCGCTHNEAALDEKQYYPNLSKADAKKRLAAIKKKHGSDWDDMKAAFDWAEDPDAALKGLELKAGVK